MTLATGTAAADVPTPPLPKQILGNWRDGPKIRIWFGEPIDLTDFYAKGDRIRTHKEIADFLMLKIAELGELDRNKFSA